MSSIAINNKKFYKGDLVFKVTKEDNCEFGLIDIKEEESNLTHVIKWHSKTNSSSEKSCKNTEIELADRNFKPGDIATYNNKVGFVSYIESYACLKIKNSQIVAPLINTQRLLPLQKFLKNDIVLQAKNTIGRIENIERWIILHRDVDGESVIQKVAEKTLLEAIHLDLLKSFDPFNKDEKVFYFGMAMDKLPWNFESPFFKENKENEDFIRDSSIRDILPGQILVKWNFKAKLQACQPPDFERVTQPLEFCNVSLGKLFGVTLNDTDIFMDYDTWKKNINENMKKELTQFGISLKNDYVPSKFGKVVEVLATRKFACFTYMNGNTEIIKTSLLEPVDAFLAKNIEKFLPGTLVMEKSEFDHDNRPQYAFIKSVDFIRKLANIDLIAVNWNNSVSVIKSKENVSLYSIVPVNDIKRGDLVVIVNSEDENSEKYGYVLDFRQNYTVLVYDYDMGGLMQYSYFELKPIMKYLNYKPIKAKDSYWETLNSLKLFLLSIKCLQLNKENASKFNYFVKYLPNLTVLYPYSFSVKPCQNITTVLQAGYNKIKKLIDEILSPVLWNLDDEKKLSTAKELTYICHLADTRKLFFARPPTFESNDKSEEFKRIMLAELDNVKELENIEVTVHQRSDLYTFTLTGSEKTIYENFLFHFDVRIPEFFPQEHPIIFYRSWVPYPIKISEKIDVETGIVNLELFEHENWLNAILENNGKGILFKIIIGALQSEIFVVDPIQLNKDFKKNPIQGNIRSYNEELFVNLLENFIWFGNDCLDSKNKTTNKTENALKNCSEKLLIMLRKWKNKTAIASQVNIIPLSHGGFIELNELEKSLHPIFKWFDDNTEEDDLYGY